MTFTYWLLVAQLKKAQERLDGERDLLAQMNELGLHDNARRQRHVVSAALQQKMAAEARVDNYVNGLKAIFG